VPLTLCVLLWSVDGQEGRLSAYEDEVLALLPEYGGVVTSRVRRVDGDQQQPYEVQVIDLPDRNAMDGYLGDPRRAALAPIRDEVVSRTETISVTPVASDPLA
jgi:uncharacterized protein (DUF1330 family)